MHSRLVAAQQQHIAWNGVPWQHNSQGSRGTARAPGPALP